MSESPGRIPGVPPGWERYEARVRELEAEGLTRSDAQGVADLEGLEPPSVERARRRHLRRKP